MTEGSDSTMAIIPTLPEGSLVLSFPRRGAFGSILDDINNKEKSGFIRA